VRAGAEADGPFFLRASLGDDINQESQSTAELLHWIGVGNGKKWVDVGCGTGALTQTILATHDPTLVMGVDRSEQFLRHAHDRTRGQRALFAVSDGQALPLVSEVFDAAVSGLVLNFVPEPAQMVSEMARVIRPGGVCALYVWDYAGKMELLRYFFDSAIKLDPEVRKLDEGERFPICQSDALNELFVACGLAEVDTRPLEVPTVFKDFDDYWTPFLGGQGPAPSYTMSLSPEKRAALRETTREALPIEEDGSINLIARAWAVTGKKA
ncbi:MAG TPA: class I SAM-dependent methyltransferase, partial [Chloroflexia bacterium]|nr:class I SAM-dependent methyltransferase [Chloroflexia bacterium]